jgi:hypothetical protein
MLMRLNDRESDALLYLGRGSQNASTRGPDSLAGPRIITGNDITPLLSEEEFYPMIERGEVKAGMVVIFRYQGPKGGPGMPEVSTSSGKKTPSLF